MTDEITFPAAGWHLNDCYIADDPVERTVHMHIDISKRIHDVDDRCKIEYLMMDMKRCVGLDCFAFGMTNDPNFNEERRKLIEERDMWRMKYESLTNRMNSILAELAEKKEEEE